MVQGTGLLAVWMQIPANLENELNDWYKQEHLPERIQIPGFLTALRYVSLQGEPRFMALYDLTTPEVLYSEAYKELRRNSTAWTRRIGRSLETNVRHEYELLQSVGEDLANPAPNVLLVRMGGEPEQEVESWLRTQMVPAMAGVPGVIRVRAFKAVVGEPKFLVYYELNGPNIFGSEAWKAAEAGAGLYAMEPKFNMVSTNLGQFIEAAEINPRS
jgi:hypothetical protein